MFSPGELLLTGIVAIVVLGPKRLPQAAYQAGLLLRKLQALLHPAKEAIHQQFKQVELERNIQRAAAVEQSVVKSQHE